MAQPIEGDFGIGYLIVEATAARGALPIPDAVVTVTSTNGNTPVNVTVETDLSGRTEKLTLPTRAVSFSLTPEEKTPYSSYTVQVYANGYYPFVASDVPIFPGVTSLQNARLIPLSAYNSEDVYPRGITTVRNTEPFSN